MLQGMLRWTKAKSLLGRKSCEWEGITLEPLEGLDPILTAEQEVASL